VSYKNDKDFDIGTEKNIYFKNFDARGFNIHGAVRQDQISQSDTPCLSKDVNRQVS